MRISKEPEERKQEILETAIKLFSVNGFEKTSISDIAKEIGIAQGLCIDISHQKMYFFSLLSMNIQIF